MKQTAKGKPLSENECQQLWALVDREGEAAVLARVRVSRSALYRALAGLPVSEGTRAIVERDLGTPRSAA